MILLDVDVHRDGDDGKSKDDYVKQAAAPDPSESSAAEAQAWIGRLTDGAEGPHGGYISDEMQTTMMEKIGIYRNENGMAAAVEEIKELRERYGSVRVQDTSSQFNTDLLELIELGNMLDLSLITAESALKL